MNRARPLAAIGLAGAALLASTTPGHHAPPADAPRVVLATRHPIELELERVALDAELPPAELVRVDAVELAPATPPTTAEPARHPAGPDDAVLAELRRCEAGGNYGQRGTWDGYPSRYSGAYQFDRPTWDGVASRHAPELVGVEPADASPADQDRLARELWLERGPAPWPHCGPIAARLSPTPTTA